MKSSFFSQLVRTSVATSTHMAEPATIEKVKCKDLQFMISE